MCFSKHVTNVSIRVYNFHQFLRFSWVCNWEKYNKLIKCLFCEIKVTWKRQFELGLFFVYNNFETTAVWF